LGANPTPKEKPLKFRLTPDQLEALRSFADTEARSGLISILDQMVDGFGDRVLASPPSDELPILKSQYDGAKMLARNLRSYLDGVKRSTENV
jgi:hypothetical protein